MKFIKKWFRNNRKIIQFTLIAFIIWQIAISLVVFLGAKYFPTTNQYLYTEKQVINPPWLWSRANFDGMYYLDIAHKGYSLYQQAFFPLYSKLITFLTPFFGGRNLVAGWTVNLTCLYLALFFFYKLIKLDFSEKVAKRTLIYLLLFPTAFFFSMVYTESLFFFLIIASFYFARTKHWWLAGIFGALASATRLPGIFLFPALLVEWWQQKKMENGKWRMENLVTSFLPILLVPLGLLWYMRFLAISFGDSLMFVHVQTFFGAGRSADKIILLYQVFWRYFKMLVTVEKHTLTYFTVVMEFTSAVIFLTLIIFTYLKRWYPYLIFMALAFIAPTLTGTFSSLSRYVLVLFPGFILLGLWGEKYRWLRILYPILVIPLLVFCLILFTRGYFVA